MDARNDTLDIVLHKEESEKVPVGAVACEAQRDAAGPPAAATDPGCPAESSQAPQISGLETKNVSHHEEAMGAAGCSAESAQGTTQKGVVCRLRNAYRLCLR